MRSDSDDQKNRPTMLNRLRRPTKPAAALASNRPLKTSWIIALACPRIAMPAVTLKQSMIQSRENGGVRMASVGWTSLVETSRFGVAGGTYPGGDQPGGGWRNTSAPATIATP